MTILFEEDWIKKHPGSIIHETTMNESFLQLSAKYEKMGIKNANFILALHDPSLAEVDPHDPDLDMETIAKIIVETKNNPWYYIREIVRIPVQGAGTAVRFKASRGTIAIYWLFLNHITSIVVQPRQTGKTVTTCSLMRWLLNIRCTHTNMNLLTLSEPLRTDTIETLKELEEHLPYYFQLTTAQDLNNTHMVTVNALGNVYRGFLPQRSIKAAANVMRGHTAPIFHMDEVSNVYNIDITMPAALAAGTNARDVAAASGNPYGTILTTNAGKKDDRSGKFIYGLLQKAMVWTEKLFDCENHEELEKVIRANSTDDGLMVNASFNHRQLGYTDEWLKKKIEEAIASGEDADRDFLNKWTSGKSASPLTKEDIERIVNSRITDPYTEISRINGFATRWYINQKLINNADKSGGLIAAIDTSDAVGNDDISLVIRNVSDGSVVAAGNFNETNLITFSEWLMDWLLRYEKLVLIIERRSSGLMMMDSLATMMISKGMNPFRRMFNWIVQDADADPKLSNTVLKSHSSQLSELYAKHRKRFGFATSASGRASRDHLYGAILTQAVKYTGKFVRDSVLIDQLTGLVVKNGRIDHEDGEHDDMVIAWLLSYWLLTQGKHLKEYNLDTLQIMRNRPVEESEDPKKMYENVQAVKLRKEAGEIIKKLQNEKNPYLVKILERKLTLVMNELQSTGAIEEFSIEELLERIRASSKKSKF